MASKHSTSRSSMLNVLLYSLLDRVGGSTTVRAASGDSPLRMSSAAL